MEVTLEQNLRMTLTTRLSTQMSQKKAIRKVTNIALMPQRPRVQRPKKRPTGQPHQEEVTMVPPKRRRRRQ